MAIHTGHSYRASHSLQCTIEKHTRVHIMISYYPLKGYIGVLNMPGLQAVFHLHMYIHYINVTIILTEPFVIRFTDSEFLHKQQHQNTSPMNATT